MTSKKSWALVICVGLLVSVCFVGFTQAIWAKEKETYVMSVVAAGNPYFIPAREALEDIEKVYGVETVYTGPLGTDISEQIADMEARIAEGVDGIIIAPADSAGLTPVIDKAVDAGIPVISWECDSPKSKRLCYVTNTLEEAGESAGQYIADFIEHKGKVIILFAAPGIEEQERRAQGYINVIEKYAGMELVAKVEDKYSVQIGAREIKSVLAANPDIKAIMGCNARSGPAAVVALREMGYKPGEVKVMAWDIAEDTLNLIKEGWIQGSTASRTYFLTFLAFQILYAYNHDILYPKTMPWKEYGISPASEEIIIPQVRVTKENVDAFVSPTK